MRGPEWLEPRTLLSGGAVAESHAAQLRLAPPIGGEDYYWTPADTFLEVSAPGLLANDYDPDGDRIDAYNQYGNMDLLHGTLYMGQWRNDGSFDYDPYPGHTGRDTFFYYCCDTEGWMVPTVVTIDVGVFNRAPFVVDPIDDVTVDQGASDTLIDLGPVFDDLDLPGGDQLTYTVTVSPPILDYVEQVSQSSYEDIHQDLLFTHLGDDRGYYQGGWPAECDHNAARDNIKDYFESLGLVTNVDLIDTVSDFSGTHEFNPPLANVVGVKLGATYPEEVYLVGAHYDSVGNPGADDNASGVAAVMEMARVLSAYTFDRTLVFVAFDGEEEGLYGSWHYVEFHDSDQTLLYTGTHDGEDNQSVLTDSTLAVSTTAFWANDALIGLTVTNLTDGSTGSITANTPTTITAVLSGGSENDWDADDSYWVEFSSEILGMVNLDMIAYNQPGENHDVVKIYDTDDLGNVKPGLVSAFADYGGSVTGVDDGMMGMSDHEWFDFFGIDAALVIESAMGIVLENPHYHQSTDAVETPDYIDYAYATDITRAVTGYLAQAAKPIGDVDLLTASLTGNQLTLDYDPTEFGSAVVTVRATDLEGLFAEDSFSVTVNPGAGDPALAVTGTAPELTGVLMPPLSTFDVTFNRPIDEATFDADDVGLIDLNALDETGGITRLGGYDTSGDAVDLQVIGTTAYVADLYAGLQILDVSNPAAVTRLGGYDTLGRAEGVHVVGSLAYVADGGSGLQILNLSDPAAVTPVGQYDTPGWANSVQVVGNLAYVADNHEGLQILDVSTPGTVAYVGAYNTSGLAKDVHVVGNRAYVADDHAGLQILDVSDPAAPTLLGGYNTSGYAKDVQVAGNLAYVADYGAGLQILNVSDPAAVTPLGGYDTPGSADRVQVVGSLAFVADLGPGPQILDVSDPTNPTPLGGYNTSGQDRAVQVVNNLAYVADNSGLQVLKLPGPDATSISHVADNTYHVDLGAPLPQARYALLLGPEIMDLEGARMDQDQDGAPGEASDDVYFTRFRIDGPPTVASLDPADDATAVPPDTNLVITFHEEIVKGTGSVVIKLSSNNSVVQTIDVGSAAVTVAGATATIDPPADLEETTGYYVEVTAGAFESVLGFDFAGISGPTDWSFITADVTNPTLLTLVPEDDAPGVAPDADLAITFSENMQKGTGDIVLKKSSDGSVVETIPVTSAAVTVAGTTATVDPLTVLADSTGYYVEVAAGAFEDLAGNDFAGISGADAWNFTTGVFPGPRVTDLVPADDETNVAPYADLVITFSENVQKGAGDIVIKKSSDGSVVQTIPVASPAVTVAGATATIDPPTTLADTTGYYVEVDPEAFEDLEWNDFTGISGAAAWNFTTGDFTPPTVVGLVPADDATGVALGANLLITFSEPVQKGTGDVVLRKSSGGSLVETIPVTSDAVTVAGLTATIDPATTLETSTGYYIEVAAGAFKDLPGNDFAGISGATAWNFTTTDVLPLVVTGTAPELTGTLSWLSTVDVTFNKPIEPDSFANADVALLDLGAPDLSLANVLGGAVNNCVTVGSLLYAATEAGVQILDVSDPGAVTRLGWYATPDTAHDVHVVGDLAYVAAHYNGGLQILDVSDPASPTLVGEYDTSGSARDVEVVGDLAYVADYTAGIQILDVSNPTSVTRLGGYNTIGLARQVQVVGGVAYVADDFEGLLILDVSDPASVDPLGSYGTSESAYGVHVVGNLAYVAYASDGLQVLDVTDPTDVTLEGGYDTNCAYSVQVVGSLAYVADGGTGLQILDVTDPAAIAYEGEFVTRGSAANVHVVGSVAYVAYTTAGLQILNVSDPAAVTPIGEYLLSGAACDVQVVGDLVYVVDAVRGLQILDTSDPADPTRLGGYDTTEYARGVHVVGDLAYLANDYDGLHVLDVSTPGSVVRLGGFNTPGDAYSVQVVGDVAYVADGFAGLQILDVSVSSAVMPLGEYNTSGDARGVHVVGNLAYVADGFDGLQILDVSDPAAVTRLGGYDTPGQAISVQVVGDLAYVAHEGDGLQILDVSDPGAVTYVGDYGTWMTVRDVQVLGTLAYVAGPGLRILDVSDPAAVAYLGGHDTLGSAMAVHVKGNLAYVAGSNAGVQVLEVGRPAASITHVAGNTYNVDLGGPLADGEYALLLGPEILDTAATPMDQDQDGTPREASDDVYFARFEVEAPPAVVGRHIFYNDSVWDGNDPTANADDDNARVPSPAEIPDTGTHDGGDNESVLTDSTASWTSDALIGFTVTNVTDGSEGVITDNTATMITAVLSGGSEDDWDAGDSYSLPSFLGKTALLPGGTASFLNYTNYYKGINGIMVDISGLPAEDPTAADFEFKVGLDLSDPSGWSAPASSPTSVAVRRGDGVGGSDRVTIIWANREIQNQWLQMTVKANEHTGLATEDVFYFGNAVGETLNEATQARVTTGDVLRTRARYGEIDLTITDPSDHTHDGSITTADVIAVRGNYGFILPLGSPPAPELPAAGESSLPRRPDFASVAGAAIARGADPGPGGELPSSWPGMAVLAIDPPGAQRRQPPESRSYGARDAPAHDWLIDSILEDDEQYRTIPATDHNQRAVDPRAVDRVDLIRGGADGPGDFGGLDDLDLAIHRATSDHLQPDLARTTTESAVDVIFADEALGDDLL